MTGTLEPMVKSVVEIKKKKKKKKEEEMNGSSTTVFLCVPRSLSSFFSLLFGCLFVVVVVVASPSKVNELTLTVTCLLISHILISRYIFQVEG